MTDPKVTDAIATAEEALTLMQGRNAFILTLPEMHERLARYRQKG